MARWGHLQGSTSHIDKNPAARNFAGSAECGAAVQAMPVSETTCPGKARTGVAIRGSARRIGKWRDGEARMTGSRRSVMGVNPGIALRCGLGAALVSVAPSLVQADCLGSSNDYVCEGASTTPISISSLTPDLSVTASSGDFSVATASGTALSIDGYGEVTYGGAGAGDLSSGDGRGLSIVARGVSGSGPTAGTSSIHVDNQGDITAAGGIGVSASNLGAGELFLHVGSVTTTGAGANFGIQASGSALGTGITIESGSVQASHTGISLGSYAGSGEVSVSVDGDATGSGGYGIDAQLTGSDSSIAIDVTGNVTGGSGDGVRAIAVDASDYIDVTVGGVATGFAFGAYVEGTAAGRVSLSLGGANGGSTGIYAVGGTGTLDVTVTGAVEGGQVGAQVQQNGTGGGVASFTNVTGDVYGIVGYNKGDSLSVSASGMVRGETGVLMQADEEGGGLALDVDEVDADLYGMYIDNRGTGDTKVTATGKVSAEASNSAAIMVINAATAGDIDLDLADVAGGFYGILGQSSGTVDTSIVSSGAITTSNDAGVGLRLVGGRDAEVDVVDVSAGSQALTFYNTGRADVILRGTVTGGSNLVYAGSTSLLDLELTETATLKAHSGLASATAVNAFAGALNLTNRGQITGRVLSGMADDVFHNYGIWTVSDLLEDEMRYAGLDLGAGDNQLANEAGGTINAATAAGSAEAVHFAGLTTFVNHGSFSLADGGAGDVARISGDATFASGSTLSLDLDAAGGADIVEVAGAATIEEGARLKLASLDGVRFGERYRVLSAAGGVTGSFSEVVSAFLSLGSTSDETNSYVTFTQFQSVDAVAVTPNQKQVAAALPEGGALANAVLLSQSEGAARDALDLFSGEIHASGQAAVLSTARQITALADQRLRLREAEVGRADTRGLGFGALPAAGNEAGFWSSAYRVLGDSDGDGNAARLTSRGSGLLLGGDALFGDWRLGMLAGYGRSDFDIAERSSEGEADSQAVGLYGSRAWGGTRFSFGLTHAWHQIDTGRSVVVGGFIDQLEADYDARSFEAHAELGHRSRFGAKVTLEPYAGLSYLRVSTDAYSESGGAGSLSGEADTLGAVISTLGLRAEQALAVQGRPVILTTGLAWQHGIGDLDTATRHSVEGGAEMLISGLPLARDMALINAGVTMDLGPASALSLSYVGRIGGGVEDNALKASLQLRF
ncbi:autotransporter domain-containing protein [Cereibacter changlensis]|uniref:autotransporter family protein n=1 Tax=Cereibacter changlensis TaxID=402884 RepID=UPI00145C9D60|nr:autotransporter domain-containing protein [Cereibacter changlensis]